MILLISYMYNNIINYSGTSKRISENLGNCTNAQFDNFIAQTGIEPVRCILVNRD